MSQNKLLLHAMTRQSSKDRKISSVREARPRWLCVICFHLYDSLEKQNRGTENTSGTKRKALVGKGSKATRNVSVLSLQQLGALCLRTLVKTHRLAV